MTRGRVSGADKDIMKEMKKLERRGYTIDRSASDHFKVTYHREWVASVPQTPSSVGLAKIELAAKVQRFERAHGMLKEEAPRSRTVRPRRKTTVRGSGFSMPLPNSDWQGPNIPAPSAHTVASILGADKIRELANMVQQPQPEREIKPRREWTEAEKAAILGRHLTTPRGGKSKMLRELGIYDSHITYWTKQFKASGAWKRWGLDTIGMPEVTAVPEPKVELVTADAEVFYEPVLVPSMDPDDEIRELTSRWADLGTRKRALLATRAPWTARITEAQAEIEKIDKESADVTEQLAKVMARLSELVGEE